MKANIDRNERKMHGHERKIIRNETKWIEMKGK